MLIVLFVIFSISLLILSHEAGHFLVARFFKLKVDEFGFGFPPEMLGIPVGRRFPKRIFGVTKGEVLYSLNWLPFGGFVKIAGENDGFDTGSGGSENIPEEQKKRLFVFQSAWRRVLVIAAGVMVNFVIGWLLISFVLTVGTPQALVVTQVQANSPAKNIGIIAGDIIKNYVEAESFIQFVNAHRGEEITVEVIRGERELTFTVVPRNEIRPDEGALGVVLGEAGEPPHAFFGALYEGFKRTAILSWLTLVAFYDVVKNLLLHGSLLEGVVGPIGIVHVAVQTSELGFMYLLQLLSLISISLAVINFIPFPALDGGRIFMILIEKIKGSPISKKAEAMANALGFVFLMSLILMVTVRDLSKLF